MLYLSEFIQRGSKIGLKTTFVRTDSDGKIQATYWKLNQEQDLAKITFEEKEDAPPVWTVGSDGRFFISNDWDGYSIEVINSNGKPEYIVERKYEHMERDSRDRSYLDDLMKTGEMPPGTDVSTTHRDLERLITRDNGDLWVG